MRRRRNYRRFHSGGRPHSHRPRRRPRPIRPPGPGLPPPTTPSPIYRRGGLGMGNQTLGFGMPGSQCTSDAECTKGRCVKTHWADSYGRCVGHGGGTQRRGGFQQAYGYGGGVHHWNDGYGHTPMPSYSQGGRVGPGVGVCNGPSTAIDEFGNNIC